MRDHYLEQFLAHLRENPDAPAPPGMDAEEAEFIRRLAKTSNQPPAHLKPLIWQHILEAAQKENMMILTRESKQPVSLVWVTAAAVIMLITAVFVVAMNFNFTPDESPSAAPLQQQSEEATPIYPTLLPSETPIPGQVRPVTEVPMDGTIQPTVVPPMVVTASPVPFDGGENYYPLPAGFLPVVTVFVPINAGEIITADMLTIVYWQADRRPSGSFERIEDVIGQFADRNFPRFMPILEGEINAEPATPTPVPTATTTPTSIPTTPTFTPTVSN